MYLREAVYFWFGRLFTVPHFPDYFIFLFIVWAFFYVPLPMIIEENYQTISGRRLWDFALFISSIVPLFFFGVAFDNDLLGLPFHFDPMRFLDYYTGSFFNLFNGFGLLSGSVGVNGINARSSLYAVPYRGEIA